MLLSQEQVCEYEDNGFVLLDRLFNPEEVEVLRQAFVRDSDIPGEHRIVERDGVAIRAVYASHLRQPEFAALVRAPRLLGPVRQLLNGEAYVYQFKINSKPAFGGEGWSWHQDYMAWQLADNLPAPNLLNVAFFLDDVTEFNGPVVFVPGSHRNGLLRDTRRDNLSRSDQHLDPDDIALAPNDLRSLVMRHGMHSPKGTAGTVLLFHPEIVHGSAANMSPFDRRVLIVTYNDVHNTPRWSGVPRPDYLVGRDTDALQFLDQPLVFEGSVGR